MTFSNSGWNPYAYGGDDDVQQDREPQQDNREQSWGQQEQPNREPENTPHTEQSNFFDGIFNEDDGEQPQPQQQESYQQNQYEEPAIEPTQSWQAPVPQQPAFNEQQQYGGPVESFPAVATGIDQELVASVKDSLRRIEEQLSTIGARVNEVESNLSRVAESDSSNNAPSVDPAMLEGINSNVNELMREYASISEVVNNMRVTSRKIYQLENENEILKEELKAKTEIIENAKPVVGGRKVRITRPAGI